MCLANKAAQHLLIFTFKYFDRYFALKMRVVSLINIGHPSPTDQVMQMITTESFPLQSWHTLSPSARYSGYINIKRFEYRFVTLKYRPSRHNLNPGAAIEVIGMVAGLLHYLVLVHGEQSALFYDDLSINYYRVHFSACGGIDQRGDRVHRRRGVQTVEIDHHQVCLLANLQRADFMLQTQGPRPIDGRHLQYGFSRDDQWVIGDSLVDDRGKFHFTDHVIVVVAGATIAAKGDIDTTGKQLWHFADAGGKLAIGGRVVRDVGTCGCEFIDVLLGQPDHMH